MKESTPNLDADSHPKRSIAVTDRERFEVWIAHRSDFARLAFEMHEVDGQYGPTVQPLWEAWQAGQMCAP